MLLRSTVKVVLEEGDFLSQICAYDDKNLKALSAVLGAPVYFFGNELHFQSDNPQARQLFGNFINELQNQVSKGRVLDENLIHGLDQALQATGDSSLKLFQDEVVTIPQGLVKVYPRGVSQAEYVKGIREHELSFGIGPAGTGKTYLAMAVALSEVLSKRRRRLILSRPVVEAGESLGFLPGDLSQKISPYLRPLYDAMEDLLPGEIINRLEENLILEIAPLAYMRGRSLKNCFVILDEAQNTTPTQMKMFLTRLGEGSKAVITGDPSQVDLPRHQESGLVHAQKVLAELHEVHFTNFEKKDVVRSSLVKRIIEAYDAHD
ncbi:MAG: PhoH family protein [Spirochaetales bacterium]|nr:PhoH family protein [Spirochaetales bacterium]